MLRAAVFLLLICTGVAAAEDEVVDWRDAAQCVGRVCGVRGTVAAVEDDGPSIRLYFDAEQRQVRVLLMRGWMVTWPDYAGETIVATAKVQRFRDHVELIVLDPGNITVLGATPSPTLEPTMEPTPPPTSAPTSQPTLAPIPPSTPGEAEQLRQQIHELQERLRTLENQ
jgi:hypothetical protein